MLKRDTYVLPCDDHTVCRGGCPPSGSPRYQVHPQTKFSAQRRFITLEEQVGVGWGELAKADSKQPQQAVGNKQQARSCSLQEWVFKEKKGGSLLG